MYVQRTSTSYLYKQLVMQRTPHEMIGNWFPVKMAEIEVCCSSDDSEQKFSWHQLSKMILNQSKRHLKMHTCSRNP